MKEEIMAIVYMVSAKSDDDIEYLLKSVKKSVKMMMYDSE